MKTVMAAGVTLSVAAAALAQSSPVHPGLWQTTVTMTDVQMPDATPEVIAMMKGHPRTIQHCVTPAEAARGPQEMLKSDPSCHANHYSMAGGTLDADMTCSSMHMTMHGSFTPTSYTAQSHMVMSGRDGMAMSATVSGRLLGPCK